GGADEPPHLPGVEGQEKDGVLGPRMSRDEPVHGEPALLPDPHLGASPAEGEDPGWRTPVGWGRTGARSGRRPRRERGDACGRAAGAGARAAQDCRRDATSLAATERG